MPLAAQVVDRRASARAAPSRRCRRRSRGVFTGSAGSNGTVHGTPASTLPPVLAPQHLAARVDVGAAVPGGEHVARLGEVGAAARAARLRPSRALRQLGAEVAVAEHDLLQRVEREAGRPEAVGAGQPLLGLDEPEPRAQRALRALRADDAREAGQPEARARQPVGVVGVLDVVAPRRPRQRLRTDDARRDRVAVAPPARTPCASRRAGSRPARRAAARSGCRPCSGCCRAASTFGTTESSA